MEVLPILRSPIWDHPALGAFAPLRAPLLAAAERLPALVEEYDALPRIAAHGDACPNNLLADPGDPDGFVLVDSGLWAALPAGFDLGQLLVGDVSVGARPAGDLAVLDARLLASYGESLAAEGLDVDPEALRRAHALELFVWRGLSALPFELLDGPPEVLAAAVPERAAITAWSLELLAATD
ncbi:MAG: hypothetical protein CMH83_03750 [Nocardioides sp.]|nr:hypothetical protein [Nocardioides sp.]